MSISISASPVIHESLGFGFTSCNKVQNLRKKIEQITLKGFPCVKLQNLDMAFGYAVFSLPNPAIDFKAYSSARGCLVEILTQVVGKSEGSSTCKSKAQNEALRLNRLG